MSKLNWVKASTGLIVMVAIVAGILFARSRGWFAGADQNRMTEAEEQDHGNMVGMNMPGMEMDQKSKAESKETAGVPVYAPVTIVSNIQQRVGMTVGTVQQEPLRMSVNTVGIVHPNETKTARIHLRA